MNNINEVQIASSEKHKGKAKFPGGCIPGGCIFIVLFICLGALLVVYQCFKTEEAMFGDSKNDTELDINTLSRIIIYLEK